MDFCAGAGGKALALAAQMENKGRMLVHDAIAERMKRFTDARRAPVLRLLRQLPRMILEFEGQCDLVVADVPCSGSGRWRRAPETKWRLTAQGLDALHELQAIFCSKRRLLLRPEGRLAYITCSLMSL